jgi:hypothetical protein
MTTANVRKMLARAASWRICPSLSTRTCCGMPVATSSRTTGMIPEHCSITSVTRIFSTQCVIRNSCRIDSKLLARLTWQSDLAEQFRCAVLASGKGPSISRPTSRRATGLRFANFGERKQLLSATRSS